MIPILLTVIAIGVKREKKDAFRQTARVIWNAILKVIRSFSLKTLTKLTSVNVFIKNFWTALYETFIKYCAFKPVRTWFQKLFVDNLPGIYRFATRKKEIKINVGVVLPSFLSKMVNTLKSFLKCLQAE